MGPTCKSYVLELLENSSHRLRQIELMRYELQHIPQVSDSEMIEAMSLPPLSIILDYWMSARAEYSGYTTLSRMCGQTLQRLCT